MHMKHFGDSYDIVKKSLLACMGGLGPWAAHPMFTHGVRRSRVAGVLAVSRCSLGVDSDGRAIELLVLHAMNFAVAGEPTYKCQAEDCGRFYAPMRKPPSGRKNFCPTCGRRASNRYSARARRAGAP